MTEWERSTSPQYQLLDVDRGVTEVKMSASTQDVPVPWDGGLLRRPTNHTRRCNHLTEGGKGRNSASGELRGAPTASCGSRSNAAGSRRNKVAGVALGEVTMPTKWWSVRPTKFWVLLAVSAVTALVVLQQPASPGALASASAGGWGRGGTNHQYLRDGPRGNETAHPSFSAGKVDQRQDSRDAAALSEVVLIGGKGHRSKDEEFRENGPDEGLRLGLGQGLRRVDGPSNGWGQKNTHDETGGGGEGRGGRGGNTIPSPEAGALAAAARGGGEYVTGAGGGGGGGGDWRQGTTQRGVAPVPAPAPPGWGGSVPGAGAAAAGAAAGGAAKAKSVVLGIPTVPRPQGVNYLDQTLQALLAQVEHDPNTPSTERAAMSILVMNVYGPGHDAFYRARDTYGGKPGIAFLTAGEAVDREGNPIVVGEGEALDAKARAKRKTLPLAQVRKQTRDLVNLLRAAAGRAEHYLFMEDDMLLCEGGAAAIGRMLNKAHSYHPDWIAIRASFGMNGIFIQDRDVVLFADYLERHQKRRPPDHLVVEWFAGETSASGAFKGDRRHMAFRYNIFEHLGSVSTLRGKASPTYPTCFEELNTQTLFEVEAFDVEGCPEEDMSPCDVPVSVKTSFPRISWQDKYAAKP